MLSLHQVHECDHSQLAHRWLAVVRQGADLPRARLKALAQPPPILVLGRQLLLFHTVWGLKIYVSFKSPLSFNYYWWFL